MLWPSHHLQAAVKIALNHSFSFVEGEEEGGWGEEEKREGKKRKTSKKNGRPARGAHVAAPFRPLPPNLSFPNKRKGGNPIVSLHGSRRPSRCRSVFACASEWSVGIKESTENRVRARGRVRASPSRPGSACLRSSHGPSVERSGLRRPL